MSSNFIDNAHNSEHIMKNNIMKDDFNWEVPVEIVPLPSKGKVYDPNSLLYNLEKIKIKAMTATEEDILSSTSLIKSGTAIDQLLKSCLVNKNIDPSELILGDRNALMISIRITGYGSDYPFNSKCEACNSLNENKIDLSDLEIKRLNIEPVQQGKNEFSLKLPVSKKTVVFKFLSEKDEKDRKVKNDFYKKMSSVKMERSVTSFLEASIISIDGITDKNKITHFVKYMPAHDSRILRNYINDNEPGIKMTQDIECKNCGHVNNVLIPINSNFFWP